MTEQHRTARQFRAAFAKAGECDAATRQVASAVDALEPGAQTREARSAAQTATARCEDSWIAFSGLAHTRAESGHRQESEGLASCNEGYFGRWMLDDDLLYALDHGLTQGDVQSFHQRSGDVDSRCPPAGRSRKRPTRTIAEAERPRDVETTGHAKPQRPETDGSGSNQPD